MKRTAVKKKISEIPRDASSSERKRRPKWAVAGRQAEAPAGEEAPYFVRSISRALDVLEAFDEHRPTIALKDLSRIVGVPGSSLFRMLMMLQSRNYLEQNDDGSYQLAAKVLYGRLYEQAERFRRLVLPELQNLASQFNENASLAYLFGDRIQVIDSVESFHEIRLTNRRGRVLPPHCSAMGKAITAFQPPQEIDRILETYGLTPRTPNSISDRRALIAHFEQVRASGMAYDREESTPGGICVAAAIRAPQSRVVAAISVSTPLARIAPEREKEIAAGVLQTSQVIARLQAAD
jgi:DNA-binding IclR family transcriptional regulator